MLKAIRDKSQGQRTQIAQSRTRVAPTKGWYVGSPMAAAPPDTAFLLENAFPEIDYVRIRGGATQFATGMVGKIQTLLVYTDGTLSRMFAYNAGNIYDVSSAGAVGAALVTGLSTTAIMSYIQFAGLGGQYLVCANGVDPIQFFNGTTWLTAPAWTGNDSPIAFVWSYNHRIYGIAADGRHIWYTGVNALGGAVTVLPMEPLMKYGGKLLTGGTWTQLSSNGIIYQWYVITSEGEVIIFTGSYPGDPNSWRQSGSYKISRPLGQNCAVPAGADVAILTEDGIVPLSQVQQLDQTALANVAVTFKIAPAYRDAVIARAGLRGWQMTIWPPRAMAIVNMPQIGFPNIQFVSNARTGAWARYSGWDAQCFAVYGIAPSYLFYGTSDGRVMQAENSGADDGQPYSSTIFYSYNDFSSTDIGLPSSGQSISRKHVTMVRARFQTNITSLRPKISVNVDFDVTIPTAPAASSGAASGALWGVAKWGVDVWPAGSSGIFQLQDWVPVYADASQLAPIVQVSLNTASTPDVRLTSCDVLFEPGSIYG
jgi:hypothetical protein